MSTIILLQENINKLYTLSYNLYEILYIVVVYGTIDLIKGYTKIMPHYVRENRGIKMTISLRYTSLCQFMGCVITWSPIMKRMEKTLYHCDMGTTGLFMDYRNNGL